MALVDTVQAPEPSWFADPRSDMGEPFVPSADDVLSRAHRWTLLASLAPCMGNQQEVAHSRRSPWL